MGILQGIPFRHCVSVTEGDRATAANKKTIKRGGLLLNEICFQCGVKRRYLLGKLMPQESNVNGWDDCLCACCSSVCSLAEGETKEVQRGREK